MNVPRSSNSLLLMIRLLTLATISSTMAPEAGADRARRHTTAPEKARVERRLVAVFARVVEGEDGAVDMDLRVLLEVGDVALEGLLPLLAEQLQLEAALHFADIGVL